MKKIIVVLFTLVWACSLHAQKPDDLYFQIEKKLSSDKKYLDIYANRFSPKELDFKLLKDIPLTDGRGVFNFKIANNVTYSIVFLKDNMEFDSLVILYVKEITDKAAADQQLFAETGGAQVDSNVVLRFKDLQELYFNQPAMYSNLYNLLTSLNNLETPVSLLQINTAEKVKTSAGISSEGNIDFLNYYYTNSNHKYPKLTSTVATTDRRNRAAQVQQPASFQLDIDFSHISFFHSSMDYGFGYVGTEINTDSRVLNILPWQSMTVSAGVRSLISTSGSFAKSKDDFLIDAKLMGRFRVNTTSFVKDLPFIFTNNPLLNIGSGIVLDVKTTGLYGFPFLNVYIATGSEDIKEPYIKVGNEAYFSFTQWETTMSFFWNNNKDMFVRYKMDVGVGGFNVVKGDYSTPIINRTYLKDVVQPLLNFSINIVPNNVEFAGVEGKLFDSRITFKFWMKLLDFSQDHTIRFETLYLSAPFFRNAEPWEEEKGSSMIQLRYRYGF